MTSLGGAWRRISTGKHGRLYVAGVGLVVVALGGVALRVPPAIADAQKIEGKPVPGTELPSVVAAATACPALTPARLAGQLMALTGFDTAASGASIAGVDDSMWTKWKPAANAERDDDHANVLALSHQDCEYVGELRVAGVPGDLFELAVAAQHGGMDAVLSAKGVPAAQKDFVGQVTGYAAWYADTDQFSARSAPSAAEAAAASAVTDAVPADLVGAVTKAGGTCREITPARIAAQLKAASNFEANLRTDTGEGIAQFSPAMWAQYASPTASVWNAADAIGVLGEAMCDLTHQFAAFTGTDPWQLALGAFQWGPATVRQAGGLPKTSVAQLATAAQQYLAGYQAVLGTPSAGPSAPASVPASVSASPKPSSSPKPSISPSSHPTSASPSPAKTFYKPGESYYLTSAWANSWANSVIDVPGTDQTGTPSGTPLQLWLNSHDKDMTWKITPAPDAGYVIITNNQMTGMSLGVENNSTENGAKLVIENTDANNQSQQWSFIDANDGKVFIVNRHSGRWIDLPGFDEAATNSDGTWNGDTVEQYDGQFWSKDHYWFLTPAS